MVTSSTSLNVLLVLITCNICSSFDIKDSPSPSSERPYVIRLTKFLCVDQPYKNTEVHICSMKFRRNKPPCFNLHITFTKPTTSLHLHFAVYYKYNSFQPLMPAVDYDVCKYLAEEKGKGTNKVADMITLFTKSQYGPFSRCPFHGRLNSTDTELQEDYLPPFLPAGDYRFDVRYYDDNNDTWVYNQLFFNVRAKGIVDLSMG